MSLAFEAQNQKSPPICSSLLRAQVGVGPPCRRGGGDEGGPRRGGARGVGASRKAQLPLPEFREGHERRAGLRQVRPRHLAKLRSAAALARLRPERGTDPGRELEGGRYEIHLPEPGRLLYATGVRKKKTPLEEFLETREQVVGSFDKLMARSDQAVAAAQETQRATEAMFQRLENYCSEKVPAQMVKALDAVAQEGIRKSLVSLNDTVARASQEIDGCRKSLSHLSWNWRLLTWATVVGLAKGLVGGAIGGGLVDYYLFSAKHVEMQRLAWWGRNLDTRMGQTPPKDQEKIRCWLNGGRL